MAIKSINIDLLIYNFMKDIYKIYTLWQKLLQISLYLWKWWSYVSDMTMKTFAENKIENNSTIKNH